MISGNPMREVLSRGFGQAGPLLENDFRNVRQLREEIGRNDQVRIGHQGRRRPRRRLSSVRHSRNLRRFGAPASDVRYRRVPQRRTHLRGLRQEYQRGGRSRARPRGCGAPIRYGFFDYGFRFFEMRAPAFGMSAISCFDCDCLTQIIKPPRRRRARSGHPCEVFGEHHPLCRLSGLHPAPRGHRPRHHCWPPAT